MLVLSKINLVSVLSFNISLRESLVSHTQVVAVGVFADVVFYLVELQLDSKVMKFSSPQLILASFDSLCRSPNKASEPPELFFFLSLLQAQQQFSHPQVA